MWPSLVVARSEVAHPTLQAQNTGLPFLMRHVLPRTAARRHVKTLKTRILYMKRNTSIQEDSNGVPKV